MNLDGKNFPGGIIEGPPGPPGPPGNLYRLIDQIITLLINDSRANPIFYYYYYKGIPGERGEPGLMGPPGRDGEKGPRGKRGKRVSHMILHPPFNS